MTRLSLAGRAGLLIDCVARIETGRIPATPFQARELAAVLGVTVAALEARSENGTEVGP